MDQITNWAQVLLLIGGGAGALIGAVALLFKTMGSSYGGIIAALQLQNVSQQEQINSLKKEKDAEISEVKARQAECESKHADCERTVAELRQGRVNDTAELAAVKRSVAAVEKKVNGG